MKLVGELKKEVEKIETQEGKKEAIKKAGMELSDEELDQVAGGTHLVPAPILPKLPDRKPPPSERILLFPLPPLPTLTEYVNTQTHYGTMNSENLRSAVAKSTNGFSIPLYITVSCHLLNFPISTVDTADMMVKSTMETDTKYIPSSLYGIPTVPCTL